MKSQGINTFSRSPPLGKVDIVLDLIKKKKKKPLQTLLKYISEQVDPLTDVLSHEES